MEENKIIEGNIIIAEFDGWYQKVRPSTGILSAENPYYRDNDKEAASILGFKYNTSWDWLMPVVEKIAKLGFNINIHIGTVNSSAFIVEAKEDRAELRSVYWSTPLKATYDVVVEFIQWYNQNQTK